MKHTKDLTVINKEFDSLMDKFFGDRFRRSFFDDFKSLMSWPMEFSLLQPKGTFPKVNVSESDTSFDVEIAMAGFDKEHLNLSLEDNNLIISCKHCEEKKEGGSEKNYLLREISCRNFERVLRLPKEVETEGVSAEYKDGVVKVVLKKKGTPTVDTKVSIDIK